MHEIHLTLGETQIRVFNRSFNTLLVYHQGGIPGGDYEMEVLEVAEATLIPNAAYPTTLYFGNADRPMVRFICEHPDKLPFEIKIDLDELD